MFSHFIETRRFDSSFSTSNVVYRRAALDGHRFDAHCSYWEDTDLGFRVRNDGWDFAFADDALVYHQVVPQTAPAWLLWPRRYANWPAKTARYPEFRNTLFLRVWGRPHAHVVRPCARRRARNRVRPPAPWARARCPVRRELYPHPGSPRPRARGEGGPPCSARRRRVLFPRRRQRSSSIGGALMDMKMFKPRVAARVAHGAVADARVALRLVHLRAEAHPPDGEGLGVGARPAHDQPERVHGRAGRRSTRSSRAIVWPRTCRRRWVRARRPSPAS